MCASRPCLSRYAGSAAWSSSTRRPLCLAAPTGIFSCSSHASGSWLPSRVMLCSSRTFYDKIREQRDGSDDGPDQMFEDFAKHPHRQRVPAELHVSSRAAVDGAERLHLIFVGLLIFLMAGTAYLIGPFNGDQYSRPEGYGVTEPREGGGGRHGRSGCT
ncbi:hypothetical protein ABL78_3055 [Leptomonas seymouri]|uniref:Transmembrane protein n=1 Tax=Leptomonas seymouri TaxID=5684 RepID=A0A0N1ILJ0_LEPSE|nr:hypothetical protein ABL78_3055 [Leptomonas seymouri]|eukprot:KPI87828.1 hypothetical protein ABL78_3055 [Leptomonas seymouri]